MGYVILIVPAIGLCAGIYGLLIGKITLEQLQSPLYCVGGAVVLYIVVNFIFSLRRGDTETNTGSWTNPEADIPDAVISDVSPGTKMIRARGRYFLVQMDRRGKMSYAEADSHGKPKGRWVHSDPSSWRFGDSPNEGLAKSLKSEINQPYTPPEPPYWDPHFYE